MTSINKIIISVIGVFTIFFGLLPSYAAALDCSRTDLTAKEAVQCGSCRAAGETDCGDGKASEKTLNETIASIVNLLSVVIGIVAVIMIMLAGFRYITSGGNTEKVTSAKNALMYAVIGLIIVALAQVLVRFVLHTTTKSIS